MSKIDTVIYTTFSWPEIEHQKRKQAVALLLQRARAVILSSPALLDDEKAMGVVADIDLLLRKDG